MKRRSLAAVSSLVSVTVLAVALPARADVKADCLAAYEKAQVEKKESRLTTAREQLLICAQDVCPPVVKKDCTPWLAEVEQALPTVILVAKDSKGKDLAEVKVFVDGFPFASSLDGSARNVDPGKHVFRFESGKDVVEETVVIREAEKRRAISVTIGAPAKSKAQPAAQPPATPPVTEPPREPEKSGGSKIPAIGVGVLGIAAIGAGVFIGMQAKSDADDLRSSCAPNCAQSKIDDVESKLLLSDIGLGVGVVAIAAAVVLWIAASPSEPAKKNGKIDGPLRIRF
jgi:hypothetical protein